jgi:ribosomal protein S7
MTFVSEFIKVVAPIIVSEGVKLVQSKTSQNNKDILEKILQEVPNVNQFFTKK